MSPGFKTALGYLAALALIEAGAIFVMENYERVRTPEWVGYSGEANRNAYLAAQRFVEAMGRPARSVASLYGESALPPPDASILVTSDRRLMSPLQSRRLLAWVESGGDLIVTLGDALEKDPVAQVAGVHWLGELQFGGLLPSDYMGEPETWVTYDASVDGPEQPAPEASATDDGESDDGEEGDDEEAGVPPQLVAPDAVAEPEVQPLHFPGSHEVLEVRPTSRELEANDSEAWQVFGDSGAYVVRAAHGKGTITVLASMWILGNQVIGEADHAAFLWAVLTSNGHTGPVWIVYGEDAPSIWLTIAQHGWPALVPLVLLVVMLLWRYMPRVGAPIAPEAPIRRELMEHVDATGRFLVDHLSGHVLVASVQKHVKKRLLTRYPQVAALPERERRARLATLAKLSPVDVDAIYRPQVGLSRSDFVSIQRVLERLSQAP